MDWADRVNESNAVEQANLDRFVRKSRALLATSEEDRTLNDTCVVEATCKECHLPLRRNRETGYAFEVVEGKCCSNLCAGGGRYNG